MKKLKPWTGKIRIGSPRRIQHGDTLDVMGVRMIFVKRGQECEVRDREVTVKIHKRAWEIAASVAFKLRNRGVDARRTGRTISLKRDPVTIYGGERRLPVIIKPKAFLLRKSVRI